MTRERIVYGLEDWWGTDNPAAQYCESCGAHLGQLHNDECPGEECTRCSMPDVICDCPPDVWYSGPIAAQAREHGWM